VLDGLPPLLILFGLLWLVSLPLRNSSIVDIWWGPVFVLATVAYLEWTTPAHPRAWLTTGAVTLWAARLAWHIGRRNVGHGEDARYAAWRRQAGANWWWRSYFKVFLLQGVIAWIVSSPLYFAVRVPASAFPSVWDVIGAALFLVGLAWETIGDAQLARFKRNPANRGRVMDQGLWRLSRHPNYFGEAVLWWGLGLLGVAGGGLLGLVGPALMTWLLLRVSGVALLERTLATRPGYADYIARTPAFLPWPRK
jgi:steroid 5-alpha reductase family enzyme